MALIKSAERHQVKAFYRDQSGTVHVDWYPKSQLCLLASRSKLIEQEFPKGCGEDLKPTMPEKEVRADRTRDCSQSEKVPEEACELSSESHCPQERKV